MTVDLRQLATRSRAAALLAEDGRTDEAIVLLGALVADCDRELGPTHVQTVLARNNRAMRLAEAGLDGAVEELAALVPIADALFGPHHPRTLMIRNNLGAALGFAGRVEEAIDTLGAVLTDGATLPPASRSTVVGNLASWLARRTA